ncbi:MAG: hypothetical protein LBE35_06030 [Clostridiales bacterium]|nr:hypothetical protein [Clostridiales bacterium]
MFKTGLDEMQRARVNRVGNQMFYIMFFALFIEAALYQRGVAWLAFPNNILTIISACMLIYLIRRITIGAISQRAPSKIAQVSNIIRAIAAATFFVALIITWITSFGSPLFVASAVGLAVMGLSQIIVIISRRISDRGED